MSFRKLNCQIHKYLIICNDVRDSQDVIGHGISLPDRITLKDLYWAYWVSYLHNQNSELNRRNISVVRSSTNNSWLHWNQISRCLNRQLDEHCRRTSNSWREAGWWLHEMMFQLPFTRAWKIATSATHLHYFACWRIQKKQRESAARVRRQVDNAMLLSL